MSGERKRAKIRKYVEDGGGSGEKDGLIASKWVKACTKKDSRSGEGFGRANWLVWRRSPFPITDSLWYGSFPWPARNGGRRRRNGRGGRLKLSLNDTSFIAGHRSSCQQAAKPASDGCVDSPGLGSYSISTLTSQLVIVTRITMIKCPAGGAAR